MVLSKNKMLFLFLFLAFFVVLSTGCTRPTNNLSQLSIQLPAGVGSSKITSFENSKPMTMQSVSTQSEDDSGPDWNPSLNPANMSEVNCYMIAIAGPEADMRRNTCTTTSGQNFYVGRWKGGIPSGGVLTIEVPSGQSREIIVLGMKVQDISACKDFKQYDVDSSNISEPHIIGRVVQNLNPGNVNVNIPVTTTGALKLDDCSGPDFQFQQSSLNFGNAPSHTDFNKTVPGGNADLASYAGFNGTANLKTGFARVGNLNPLLTSHTIVTVSSSSTLSNFSAGDEVMVIMMGGRGQLGPANNNYGECGYKAWNGAYEFTHIQSISGNTIYLAKGSFLDSMGKDANGNGILNEAGDITATNAALSSSPNSATFCYVQLVKVPHFYNLTIVSAGSIYAPAFDYANEGGGVLALRVNGTLTMDTGSSIDMSSMGYQGVMFANGQGHMGTPSGCSQSAVTGTGGGCATAGMSGGGGGHGNTSGSPFSGGSGGSGYTTGMNVDGGSGAGEDCGDGSCFGSLSYKIFLGGAGGGSNPSNAGASGGGIVYVAARNMDFMGSGGSLRSNGVTASNSSTGGGAGGSVLLAYKTTTDDSMPMIQVLGGHGSAVGYGGGGGAGGRVQVTACKLAGSAQTPLTISATEGLYGAVASHGASGLPGSVVRYDIDCE